MYNITQSTCCLAVNAPQRLTKDITVLLIREKNIVARFNVPNVPKSSPVIYLCHTGLEFTELMHLHARTSETVIEMITLDGTSNNYIYRE